MKRILYWPGMGQQKDILKHLRDELSKENIIDFIDFDYDKDELDPSKWNILKNKRYTKNLPVADRAAGKFFIYVFY